MSYYKDRVSGVCLDSGDAPPSRNKVHSSPNINTMVVRCVSVQIVLKVKGQSSRDMGTLLMEWATRLAQYFLLSEVYCKYWNPSKLSPEM